MIETLVWTVMAPAAGAFHGTTRGNGPLAPGGGLSLLCRPGAHLPEEKPPLSPGAWVAGAWHPLYNGGPTHPPAVANSNRVNQRVGSQNSFSGSRMAGPSPFRPANVAAANCRHVSPVARARHSASSRAGVPPALYTTRAFTCKHNCHSAGQASPTVRPQPRSPAHALPTTSRPASPCPPPRGATEPSSPAPA